MTSDAAEEKNRMWMFDLMLYANVPLVFGLMAYFFVQLQSHTYATFELVGLLLSAGILLATNAINVAHELGHRASLPERLMSKLLYMPCLYMHFFIEHNFGHHMNVATPEDGATARYNQTVYGFWWTSVTKQYLSAWRLQAQLLKRQQLSFLSPKNDMLWYHLIQPAYLVRRCGSCSLGRSCSVPSAQGSSPSCFLKASTTSNTTVCCAKNSTPAATSACDLTTRGIPTRTLAESCCTN